MARRVDVRHLVGTAEIAARLGVKRPGVVHDWRRRYPDFPEPIGVFRAVDAPRYEERLSEQVAAAQKRGKGDLKSLFTSGETWTVE